MLIIWGKFITATRTNSLPGELQIRSHFFRRSPRHVPSCPKWTAKVCSVVPCVGLTSCPILSAYTYVCTGPATAGCTRTGALSACTAAAACVRRTRYRIIQCSAEINARLHVNKFGPRSTWKVVRWHFCVDWCRLHVLRELTRCQIKLLYGRSART